VFYGINWKRGAEIVPRQFCAVVERYGRVLKIKKKRSFSAPFLLRLAPDTPSSSHTSAILHGITPDYIKSNGRATR